MKKLIRSLTNMLPFKFKSDLVNARECWVKEQKEQYLYKGFIQEGIEKPTIFK